MFDPIPLLRSLPFFREVSDADLAGLAGIARAIEIRSGETLFAESSPSDGLHVIVAGKIEIWKRAFDGTEQHLATLGSGETIGEMSLLDGDARSAGARAAEDGRVLLFRRDEFQKFLVDRPALGIQFLLRIVRMLTARLRRTSQELADVVSLSAPEGE